MRLRGGQIVMECLIRAGVKDVFGYPGGAVLPLYDAFIEYPQLRHVLVRHEQGAGFAAQGYARATGKVGVCLATSGPGATNLVTPIADAYMDSIPVVFITGQVPRHLIGTDAFQETDIIGITMPITKHSYTVENAADLARIFHEAFQIAISGRPGPVLIDIPKDVFTEEADFFPPAPKQVECETKPINPLDFLKAAEMIAESSRPVIIAGNGVQIGCAGRELRNFVEKSGIPCALTIHGLGVLPDNHDLNLRLLGMHGHAETNFAVDEADLIIGVGIRFDDRITGKLSTFGKKARIIHIEIDPAEIGKNVRTDLALVGCCREILNLLHEKIVNVDRSDWLKTINDRRTAAKISLQQIYPLKREAKDELITYDVVNAICSVADPEAIIVTDVGQHQMFTAQAYRFDNPRQNLSSGGLGSMGFCLPAAMGAKVAKPETEVWSISGDGGFQMNLQELMTIKAENIPVKIVIIQNFYLGMVRQWQEIFYRRNYAHSPLSSPCYEHIAKAYDLPYFKAEKVDDLSAAIASMKNSTGPCLAEFFVKPEENVLPMVPSGAGLGETIVSLN